MQMHIVVLFAVAATVCSIVFFAMGATLGFHIADTKPKRSTESVPPKILVRTDFDQLLRAQLLSRIQTVLTLALQHQTVLPSSLWQAIDELALETQQLRQQIEGIAQKTVESNPPALIPPSTSKQKSTDCRFDSCSSSLAKSQSATNERPSTSLTGCEFQRLTAHEVSGKECSQKLSKKRNKYEATQLIYRCYETDEGRTLAPADTVRCHDLGVEGISFFWPQCPDFETLVIALGKKDNPIYLTAEVMNSKAVVMHNEACYLIGCRFISRLARFNDVVAPKTNATELFENCADSAVSSTAAT